jgi:DNA-binding CsgD family transcriptional regulator
VRSEEIELLLEIVADATLGATFHERFSGIMEAFSALVPSSSMTAFVLDVANETAPAPEHAIFRNGEIEQVQEYAAHYMHLDPMLPGLTLMDGVPTLLSDFVKSSELTRDAYTGEFLPRFGVRHIMGVAHRMPDGALLSVGVQRDRGLRDFTPTERRLVTLVSPYLSRAAYGAILRERVVERSTADSGSDSNGAGHRSGVALFDALGAMVHADSGGLALMSRLAEDRLLTLDTLVVEARSLGRDEVAEGHTVERAFVLPARGVVRVRLARAGRGDGVRILATFEHSESGAPAQFDALAGRFGLTAREREIASHAIRGFGNREIGQKLGISHVTVGVALSRIYDKAHVQSRNELTAVFLGGNVRDIAPECRAAAR